MYELRGIGLKEPILSTFLYQHCCLLMTRRTSPSGSTSIATLMVFPKALILSLRLHYYVNRPVDTAVGQISAAFAILAAVSGWNKYWDVTVHDFVLFHCAAPPPTRKDVDVSNMAGGEDVDMGV